MKVKSFTINGITCILTYDYNIEPFTTFYKNKQELKSIDCVLIHDDTRQLIKYCIDGLLNFSDNNNAGENV